MRASQGLRRLSRFPQFCQKVAAQDVVETQEQKCYGRVHRVCILGTLPCLGLALYKGETA